ncbi:MAG TPA: polyprenyl synthetase family protein [Candidatus Kapabacteria bacterium]|nr:polyprenyl synthetase family protein [Candidatus Kapabacteria bacterium]
MNSKIFLQDANEIRQKINRYLIDFVPSEPESLYTPVRKILQAGGKRVRPILTAFAAGINSMDDSWLPAAAAVELLHTFTLIHDDIMDNASTRRGLPTMHIQYGTNVAILSGDVLIALAQESLSKLDSPFVPHIIAEFANGFRMVCEGQALDKEYETRENISVTEYLAMIDLKTAKVLELAAVLGTLGGSGTYLEEIRSFAHHLGLAFQIGDDLLDLTATHAELGKTIGGDILEGKRTFLFVTAMKTYNQLAETDRNLLDRIRNRTANPDDVGAARLLFERIGVLSSAQRAKIDQTFQAKTALEAIPSGEARDRLDAFSDYLLERAG